MMRTLSYLPFIAQLTLWAAAAGAPQQAIDAHLYSDQVLYPAFVSAANEWSLQHPQDAPDHPGEHAHKLNRGDVERWQRLRKAWKELDDSMKRAGY